MNQIGITSRPDRHKLGLRPGSKRMNPMPKPPKARKPGRPASVITLAVVHAIGLEIARGLTIEQACLNMSPVVSPASLRSACKRNPRLSLEMEKAKAIFLAKATASIFAGERGWQGKAWILERRHRQQFSRNETTIMNMNKNDITVCGMNPQELEQFRAAVQRAVKEATPVKDASTVEQPPAQRQIAQPPQGPKS
jgi:hypothetical protein